MDEETQITESETSQSGQETKAALLFPDPKDPTKVGEIEVDVLVSSEITYASEVTENPVEDGFPVHDHVICQPIKMSMVVLISPLPVTWYERFGVDVARMDDAVTKLEQIYKKRKPITVVTDEKTYEDMVLTDCKISRNKEDGRVLKVPLEFTQIRKVEVRTTDIPEEYVDALTKGKVGATAQEAGAATQSTVSTNTAGNGNGNSNTNEDAGKSNTSIAKAGVNVLKGVFGR